MKLVVGNPEKDFFLQNPELRYMDPVKDLIERVGEKEASTIMWAVYLTEDVNSQLYRRPKAERRKEVADNYLKKKKFKWEEYEDIINAYPRMSMSKEKVLFKIWSDKIDEATAHIKSMSFDEEGIKVLAMMEKYGKVWDVYEKVKSKMVAEESKSNVLGGGNLSYREKRNKT